MMTPCLLALRSHVGGQLSPQDVDATVRVVGFLAGKRRVGEALVFFPLRDRFGFTAHLDFYDPGGSAMR